jgi:UDP-glucose 4-epimerase
MKCVVTGGLGFIGSHVVDLLVQQGMEVAVVDNLATGQETNLNPLATLHRIDLGDLNTLKQVSYGAEFFFHMAALPRIQPSFDHPKEHEEVNVIGTIRCLQAVMGKSIQKFVFSGSSAIYGNATSLPTPESAPPDLLNPYALQKFAAEQYCLILGRRFGIPVVSLRYFNVYGPRSFNPKNPQSAYSSVVGIFTHNRRAGNPLTITGDGQQTRDFVHVQDVAKANLAVAYSDRSLETYNVGSGIGTTVNQLAQIIGGEVIHAPERSGEARHTVADITKIEQEVGWSPEISLEKGITRLLQETS